MYDFSSLSHVFTHFQAFFKDLDAIKQEFGHYHHTATCEGMACPRPQLERMNVRFNELTLKEVSLLRRLEYEELKYRLLGFLVVAEAKLKTVQVKYGLQEDVYAMLQDYIVSIGPQFTDHFM